ncbi:MAG: SLBB domain-containing protein, partial [Thermodesulfobacteriota bacterium]
MKKSRIVLYILITLFFLSFSTAARAATDSKQDDNGETRSSIRRDSIKSPLERVRERRGANSSRTESDEDLSDLDARIKDQMKKGLLGDDEEEVVKKEELSAFEEYIQSQGRLECNDENVPCDKDELEFVDPLFDIVQFGYEIFNMDPEEFLPPENLPIGPGYLLGPGDELVISIWGKINEEFSVYIDRDGKVNIPQLGDLYLAGQTLPEAKELLKRQLGRYYRSSEVKMNVSMGALRSMRVYVVGKVKRPGSHTISSLSSLMDALFSAGGPTKLGSMRDIQVKRNGVVITHFDLYELLLRGDRIKDVRLAPEDVVFVPTIGALVAVSGNVKAPGIYELNKESTAKDVIGLAGGLSDIAFRDRIQISRIKGNNLQTLVESNFDDIIHKDIRINPGDHIRVFSVVPENKVVTLVGAVEREGEYGVAKDMTVRDLIKMAGGLKYFALFSEAELTRRTPTPNGPVTVKRLINLQKALDGDSVHNVRLKEEDYLFVKTVPEWDINKTATIIGEVRYPGMYTINKGERLSSLIERAGGYTGEAFLRGAVFTRLSVQELQQEQLDESIDRFEQKLFSESAQTIGASTTVQVARQHEAAMEPKRALI